MHKTWLFSYNFPFFIGYILLGIKPAPGDRESNFKKVDAIPRGLQYHVNHDICILESFITNI